MIQVTHDIVTDNILAPPIKYTANPIMNPNIKNIIPQTPEVKKLWKTKGGQTDGWTDGHR